MTYSVSPSQEAWGRTACQTPLGDFSPLVLAWERILRCRERVLVESASAVCVSERKWTGHSAHRSSSCLVEVPETSPHEHLCSAWSSHVSIFGELTHSSASTGTNETWCRCPGWLCVGTACPGSPHLYCEPMVPGEETEAQRGSQSVQFSCDPMDCSTPGFPVHHQLPEFTQTHVH